MRNVCMKRCMHVEEANRTSEDRVYKGQQRDVLKNVLEIYKKAGLVPFICMRESADKRMKQHSICCLAITRTLNSSHVPLDIAPIGKDFHPTQRLEKGKRDGNVFIISSRSRI